MLTMVLGGLWHGAAWSYAVWGFFHGLVLAVERLMKDAGIKVKLPAALKAELEKQLVELQKTYQQLEQTLAEERTKLVSELLKKAGPIVTEIAKAEGVSLIVDQSAVVWADPAVDLTAALNAKMK